MSLALFAIGAGVALGVAEALSRLHFRLKSGAWLPAYPTLSAPLYEPDPLLGFRLIPGAEARLSGSEYDTRVRINDRGLRQDEEIAYVRTPGRRRVLLVGDSFTFGAGVEEADRFDRVLHEYCLGTEFVNMGAGGTGTDQQLLWYLDEGQKYSPDLVVLAYMVENILRNWTAVRIQPDGTAVSKPRFQLDGTRLLYPRNPISRTADDHPTGGADHSERRSLRLPIPFKRFLQTHSALYLLARSTVWSQRSRWDAADPYPEYGGNRDEWKLTRELVATFANEVRRRGSAFLLVIIPTADYVSGSIPTRRPFNLIRKAMKDQRVQVLDLLPPLRRAASAESEPLYYGLDGHWTPAGHRVVGRIVLEHIRGRWCDRTLP